MRACAVLLSIVIAPAALGQAPLYDLSGQPGDEFGHSLATIGDVDGDGFDDVAIGAPFGDGLQVDAGYVNIYSARTGGWIRTLQGERTGDHFGWSVAGLGDIDGDGIGDLIVGAPFHEISGTDKGAAYLFSGASGAQIWKQGGNADDDWLGWAVAGIGDATGDGVPDYAIGQPNYDLGLTDIGRVVIMSGASHTTVRTFIGDTTGSLFGFAIAAAGDVDGDSRGDLVIGAPYYPGTAQPTGRAYLVKMTQVPSGWTVLAQGSAGGHLGHSVAAGADFDGDGVPDFAIGEPYRQVSAQPAGRVLVLSAVNYVVLHTFNGAGNDLLGYSVAALRDADGDGRGDLAIGSPKADIGPGVDFGLANVYSGATWGLLYQAGGYATGDGMGTSVASAGLLNADSSTDVLCGASWSSVHGAYCGRARLLLGNAPYPTGYCTAKTNSASCAPFISFTGCASVSISDGFHLEAREVLPNVAGNLIWSMSAGSAPFHGGTLCIGFPIRRTPIQISTSIAATNCTGLYNFHFSHAYMASWGLGAGTDFYAQYWSRDPGFPAPNNIGLTNGLKCTVLP